MTVYLLSRVLTETQISVIGYILCLMKYTLYPYFVFICLLLLMSPLSASNALWVWDMADDIVLDEVDRMDFWSFIEAPHAKPELKISTVYLSVGRDLLNNHPRKVGEFIADAHSRGLKVEYLTGDPLWSLSDTNPDTGKPYNQPSFDELEDLLAYNAKALENERFDGYHQDTEPYTLGLQSYDPLIWGIDTEEIWTQFVETTEDWKDLVDAHNLAEGDDLIMGSAIPFWWDPEDGTAVNHQTIQDIVDYVSIMNYNTRTGFQETVANEIGYASANGKDVYVGMETLELVSKEPVNNIFRQMYTTSASYFYGRDLGNGALGIEGMAQNVGFLENHYSDATAFEGIAFHYYEDIKNGDSAFRALGYNNRKNAPAVWIITPSCTEILSGSETIRYVAYDPDGDELNITIEYSDDDGTSWSPISNFNVSDSTDEVTYRSLN